MVNFGQAGEIFASSQDDAMSDDVVMRDASDGETEEEPSHKHFIVAIDFGTTFSSVAYVALEDTNARRRIDIDQVELIDLYPDDPVKGTFDARRDVPTEIWYPKKLVRNHFYPQQTADGDADSADEADSDDHHSQHSRQENSSESFSEDESYPTGQNDAQAKTLFWGYGVQKQLQEPDMHGDNTKRIARFKLMLDEKSEYTADLRAKLSSTFKTLKKLRLIEQPNDAIADYLEQLFVHTKRRLEDLCEYCDLCTVEFVLCVPAIWTTKACRDMQVAMAKAINAAKLGCLENGSVDNLFIVSEPEAAAACVLESGKSKVNLGDAFVLLDAGGGTVDAITYTVEKSRPLRLKTEAVTPKGALCGSSYLNEKFEALLTDKLKDEKYLERNGRTLPRIIDKHVVEFENGAKRTIDITNKSQIIDHLVIDDLLPNESKRFTLNRLYLTRKEIEAVFMQSLKGVANLMNEQLEMAKANNLVVKKVLLIGGFGQSPSLRNYLRKVLARKAESEARKIELILPKLSSTAVACGAVLRALRKEDGPSRIIQSSYGFLRTEHYEPDAEEAHRGIRPSIDKIDGQRYVTNTIDWLIKKGQVVDVDTEIKIKVLHTFGLKRKRFLCKEVLYVSDTFQESHYRKSHANNKGAEIAGSIVVDMTFLRTDGHIQPTPPEDPKMEPYYKVEFALMMIVYGRNLRYEARWPIDDGEVQGAGQICIAAAFVPGTQ